MAGLTGSPGGSTDVLGLYFYRTAFGSVTSGIQDFGQGSALAVLMFLFIAGVTSFALRILRRREIADLMTHLAAAEPACARRARHAAAPTSGSRTAASRLLLIVNA